MAMTPPGSESDEGASRHEAAVDDLDVYISATGNQLADIAGDFAGDASRQGARVRLENNREDAVYAGLEWVVPTAVAVFLANRYLGTLLDEAAKDHYQVLKAALRRLVSRTTGSTREVSITVISAGAQKVRDADPATLSLWVTVKGSRRVVFRFDHALSAGALDVAADQLFTLMLSYTPDDDDHLFARAPTLVTHAPWAPVVLRFDEAQQSWRPWSIGPSGLAAPWDGA